MRIRILTCFKLTILLGLIVTFVLYAQLLTSSKELNNNNEDERENYNKDTSGNMANLNISRNGGKVFPIQNVKEVRITGNDGENKHYEKEENKEKVENKPESVNSLAGERVHGLPNITSEEKNVATISIEEIMINIDEANRDQILINEDIFGPINNSTIVIVIQVHNRLQYLRHLISSLSSAQGIDKTLIIFSHDQWDDRINTLARSVDFALSMQIFYPFSLQTHPHIFPGEEDKDCLRDMKPAKAEALKCTNSKWPDIHGHYREAKFTQTKHHWWWKANQVFHRINITRNFDGSVLFLEEDHFVSEDFLHILSQMKLEKESKSYGEVDILSLGTYLKKFNSKSSAKQKKGESWPQLRGLFEHKSLARSLKSIQEPSFVPGRRLLWGSSFITSLLSLFHKELTIDGDNTRYSVVQKVEVTQWISAKHNMGMSFSRNVWNKIKGCSTVFCQYDDYNWDWSLQHLSLNCLKEKLQVMMVKGPRVFHIGECGVHHKKSDCDSNVVIEKVKSILKTAKTYLFPEKLSVSKTGLKKKLKMKKGNGGWGDKRDHALCINMTVNTN